MTDAGVRPVLATRCWTRAPTSSRLRPPAESSSGELPPLGRMPPCVGGTDSAESQRTGWLTGRRGRTHLRSGTWFPLVATACVLAFHLTVLLIVSPGYAQILDSWDGHHFLEIAAGDIRQRPLAVTTG